MEIGKYIYSSKSFVSHSVKMVREAEAFSGTESISAVSIGSQNDASAAFWGCQSLPNGGVHLTCYSNNRFAQVSAAGVYTEGQSVAGDARFRGSVVVSDELVVLAPSIASNIGLYNPKDDVYTDGPAVTDTGYNGGCLTKNNLVVLAPVASDYVIVYDPYSGEMTEHIHTYGDGAFGSANALPDGTVLFVPATYTNFVVFNPATGEFTEGDETDLTETVKFLSSVTLPSGDVLCIPFNYNYFVIYRFKSGGIYEKKDYTVPVNSAYLGATYMKDGRIMVCPYGSDTAAIYNPYDDTVTDSIELERCSGAATLSDGRIIMPAYDSANIYAITTSDGDPLSQAVIANRYFNPSI